MLLAPTEFHSISFFLSVKASVWKSRLVLSAQEKSITISLDMDTFVRMFARKQETVAVDVQMMYCWSSYSPKINFFSVYKLLNTV